MHTTPIPHTSTSRPPISALILYSVGQMGWSLASFAVGNLLVYFYMPPEQGAAIFPSMINQNAVLGVLTIIGIISAAGRILDGIVDPLVANWSDRKRAKIGKRRWFMLLGALPFALFATLIFFPPSISESTHNILWLSAMTALYYFFFAFYVIPYNALIAELGHTAEDRLLISTLLSVAWALGFVLGNSTYALQGMFEGMGQTPLQAFQTTILLLHGLALLLLILPALFLNEKRYARQMPSEHSIRESLTAVFGDRNFRWFLGSFLLYWLALTFIQLGTVFYTTLLFGLDKSAAFTFSLISFLCSFLLYIPLNMVVKRWGKRRIMLGAFWLFGGIFIVVMCAKSIPIPKDWLLYALAAAAAGPLATFGILPNAIIGDEVARVEEVAGKQLAGMFFGVSALTMKIGISVANLIFPSLLLLGKSADNPFGVQCTAFAALIFCLAGWWTFKQYRPI